MERRTRCWVDYEEGKTRDNRPKLWLRRFRLHIWKSVILEGFGSTGKDYPGKLCYLHSWGCARFGQSSRTLTCSITATVLLWREGWTRWPPEVCVNPHFSFSVIVYFYKTFSFETTAVPAAMQQSGSPSIIQQQIKEMVEHRKYEQQNLGILT